MPQWLGCNVANHLNNLDFSEWSLLGIEDLDAGGGGIPFFLWPKDWGGMKTQVNLSLLQRDVKPLSSGIEHPDTILLHSESYSRNIFGPGYINIVYYHSTQGERHNWGQVSIYILLFCSYS